MFLIAADAIERLGKHNVELAFTRIFKEPLIPRPEGARARYATVRVSSRERPFLTNDPLSANEELVLNRGRTLEVGRIAGIYAYAHGSSLCRDGCIVSLYFVRASILLLPLHCFLSSYGPSMARKPADIWARPSFSILRMGAGVWWRRRVEDNFLGSLTRQQAHERGQRMGRRRSTALKGC